MNKGFTLIELLIVVAIIAILAAIAVPNFLEAQTRAKISRSRADMRTIATAFETYAIDNSKYPFDRDPRGWPNTLTDIMTTPVSYLTQHRSLSDTFRANQTNLDARRYRYYNVLNHKTPSFACPFPSNGVWFNTKNAASPAAYDIQNREFGGWMLSSAGPDKNAETGANPIAYEATNGTVSKGDIVLSQKGMR